jgi:dishevelled associated activator of morphogenesis
MIFPRNRLTNETDIKSYQQKLREVEKANDEIQSKLTKKEREAEIRTQEKEELLDTVNKMKTKLEKEAAGHQETKQHINDLNRHIEELKAQVSAKMNV